MVETLSPETPTTATVGATVERPNTARISTTYTSREFNQQVGNAKKAAEFGPVFITDRGKRTHVLLSIAEYRRLTGTQGGKTLFEALYCPELAGIDEDFEFPKIDGPFRPAEFE
jgi:prevent-host-death family protein